MRNRKFLYDPDSGVGVGILTRKSNNFYFRVNTLTPIFESGYKSKQLIFVNILHFFRLAEGHLVLAFIFGVWINTPIRGNSGNFWNWAKVFGPDRDSNPDQAPGYCPSALLLCYRDLQLMLVFGEYLAVYFFTTQTVKNIPPSIHQKTDISWRSR